MCINIVQKNPQKQAAHDRKHPSASPDFLYKGNEAGLILVVYVRGFSAFTICLFLLSHLQNLLKPRFGQLSLVNQFLNLAPVGSVSQALGHGDDADPVMIG